jgi:hypothetical protein
MTIWNPVVPPGGIHSGSRILAPLWADDDDDDDDDELWRPVELQVWTHWTNWAVHIVNSAQLYSLHQ